MRPRDEMNVFPAEVPPVMVVLSQAPFRGSVLLHIPQFFFMYYLSIVWTLRVLTTVYGGQPFDG